MKEITELRKALKDKVSEKKRVKALEAYVKAKDKRKKEEI